MEQIFIGNITFEINAKNKDFKWVSNKKRLLKEYIIQKEQL